MDFTEELGRAHTERANAFDELLQQMRRSTEDARLPEPGGLVDQRYEVVRTLGRGGFGTVLEVEHVHLGRRFAMKLLNPAIASDPDWATRFREEARATSLIGHENIVLVTDFGQCEEFGYYFVMEYLDGRPLDQVLAEEGAQTPERVLAFARAAGSALGAVHDLGIVHCDLKPSNAILLERPGRADAWKLLDFGTSTIVMNVVESETLFGTPLYMAPEQAAGGTVDRRADVFSLGCIIYEMLTGAPPWEVKTWLNALPEARQQNPPTRLSEVRDDLPAGWQAAIDKALQVRSDDRWASAEEFVRALTQKQAAEARADPFDRGDPGFTRSGSAPRVRSLALDEPSVVSSRHATGYELVFRTLERLTREYRRNMVVGGLFVPCEELPELQSTVVVQVRLEGTDHAATLRGMVVRHETRPDELRGFGVAFLPDAAAAAVRFVEGARASASASAEGTVVPTSLELRPDAKLSVGEGFVLSRVDAATPLSRLRAYCAGLPFDVDEAVASLVAAGYLRFGGDAEPSPTPAPSPAPKRESARVTLIGVPRNEIDQILERARQFVQRGHPRGAIDVLQRASRLAPQEHEFQTALAEIFADELREWEAATVCAERAAELAPEDAVTAQLLERIRNRTPDK